MNTIDLQDLSSADRAFAEAARAGLRARENLNYVESARLAAARARARELVTATRPSSPMWAWLLAPAAVAALAVMVVRFESSSPAITPLPAGDVLLQLSADVNAPPADALMWVSDEAGPDFYRDLKFYEWLQSRSPTEPNA